MVAERSSTPEISTIDDDTLEMGVYIRAARRSAAKDGWETRRAGMTLRRRFNELGDHVADGPARLLCCDPAERIALPVYQAAYPNDPRPALILWTARCYARGAASEYERLAARRVSLVLTYANEPGGYAPRTGVAIAVQAIGWCLNKHTSSLLWACTNWLEGLMEPPHDGFYQEVVAALEAMPHKVPKAPKEPGTATQAK